MPKKKPIYCKNCDDVIHQEEDGYWFHTRTGDRYCQVETEACPPDDWDKPKVRPASPALADQVREELTPRVSPELIHSPPDRKKFNLPDDMTFRAGQKVLSKDEWLREILAAAYKADDKPHQLFSRIRGAAIQVEDDPARRTEIVRLMDLAYFNVTRTLFLMDAQDSNSEPEPPKPTACSRCGTSYKDCNESIRENGGACCGTCRQTETHNQTAWENRYGWKNPESDTPVSQEEVKP